MNDRARVNFGSGVSGIASFPVNAFSDVALFAKKTFGEIYVYLCLFGKMLMA